MSYPISDRANKATENFWHIKEAIRQLDRLHVDPKSSETGVSTHERVHLIDFLGRRIKEIEKILEEEVK